MVTLSRRFFVLGAAATALAGCSADSERFRNDPSPYRDPQRPRAMIMEDDEVQPAPRSSYRPVYVRPFAGQESVGSIIINNANFELALVEQGPYNSKQARVYSIGIGREGFTLSPGAQYVIRGKKESPRWTPPEEMRERELRENGRVLPPYIEGGLPNNPLGTRALYLHKTTGGDSAYRIHGTSAPETIGRRMSSGCVRMMNQDVEDLYERVRLGATVSITAYAPPVASNQPLQLAPYYR
jgi:lipoprotein-anchoring transpeptidase ErfK/SrfK